MLFAQTFGLGIAWIAILLAILLATAFEMIVKFNNKLDELFPEDTNDDFDNIRGSDTSNQFEL